MGARALMGSGFNARDELLYPCAMTRIFPVLAIIMLLAALPAAALGQNLDKGLAAYDAGDYGAAMALLRPLAEGGDAIAQQRLGVMYHLGRGVDEDPEQAMLWTRRAAELGDIKAQNNLAYLLFFGLGAAQDRPEAVRWYKRAAEAGDVASQNTLGTLYRFGYGVLRDDREAAQWFDRAVAQGDADSQLYLGVMYERGEGVAQDRVRAQMLYLLAAAQGEKEAVRNRDFNATRMSAAQIAEAERLASEWQQVNSQ